MYGGSDIKADPVDQRRLLDLQALDTETARLQHRRRSLPEHVDIAQGKQKRLAVMETLVETETKVSDLERAQRKAEADLEPVRQRRVRISSGVDDGSVTDPKQLNSLIEEVEHLGRRIGELEDAELEVMGELEDAQAEAQRLTEEKGALETQLRAWMASRDEQVAELDAKLAEQATERSSLLTLLPDDLVALYEKVRSVHDGLGAAELQHGRCSGCRLDANAADLRAYAEAPVDQVIRCEEMRANPRPYRPTPDCEGSMPTRAIALTEDAPDELVEGLTTLQQEVGLSEEFPEAAEEEAIATCGAPRMPAADLSGIDFFAIDPPGAKDIDQVMELSRDGSGYLVRYAIADLTAFITPGGPIDHEAHQRGQTLYAPHMRFPLHPPVLSEGSASLHAGQSRPAYVWQIRLDGDGEVADVDLGRAIVRSRAQLNYAEVQQQLDERRADGQIELLREIGSKRLGVEIARGGVSLNLPALEVEVVDDQWRLRFRAAREVEDWNAQISLLTGICAANLMLEAKVGIVRTLPPAGEGSLQRLRRVAAALQQPWPQDMGYPDFVRSIDPDTPRGVAMMYACTALFRGADYAAFDGALPEQTEHAALATPYAHSTAPLRRLVDRYSLATCAALVAGEEVPEWVREALPKLPEEMRASNSRASRFERGVLDLVEALVLHPSVGQSFEGTVVSVDEERSERGSLLLDSPAVEGPVQGQGLVAGERISATLESADLVEGKVRFAV